MAIPAVRCSSGATTSSRLVGVISWTASDRRRAELRLHQRRHPAAALSLLDRRDRREARIAAGTLIATRLLAAPRRSVPRILFGAHAAAMVGATQPPADDATRAAVLLVGSKGTSCTGVAIARDLVLTAGHCVLPGADYKLVEFDAAHTPTLKDTAAIARHPDFDVNGGTAPSRHRRRGADQVSRGRDGNARSARAGGRHRRGRRPLRGRGLRPRGARRRQERRHAAHRHARRHRPAGLAAIASRRSRDQGRARRASAPAPAIPARRCSATSAAR